MPVVTAAVVAAAVESVASEMGVAFAKELATKVVAAIAAKKIVAEGEKRREEKQVASG